MIPGISEIILHLHLVSNRQWNIASSDGRTKGVRNRDRKYTLYSQWEQLSGNRDVQRIKVEVKERRER